MWFSHSLSRRPTSLSDSCPSIFNFPSFSSHPPFIFLSILLLSNKTFSNDENGLYLHFPIELPLATCSYWAFKMGVMQLRMRIFNLILNSYMWLAVIILNSAEFYSTELICFQSLQHVCIYVYIYSLSLKNKKLNLCGSPTISFHPSINPWPWYFFNSLNLKSLRTSRKKKKNWSNEARREK